VQMFLRKGLTLISALLVLGAAATATAEASNSTTAFTCLKGEVKGPGFSKAHCKAADAVGSNAGFSHVAIPPAESTETRWTNETTGANTEAATIMLIKATLTPEFVLQLQATGVSGTGVTENRLEGVEHSVESRAVIQFTGVTAGGTGGKGCVVKEGKITTTELKITTVGQGMSLKLAPVIPKEPFATFVLEGCLLASLNGARTFNGSVNAIPDGATTNLSHAEITASKTLTLGTGSVLVGFEGPITASARVKGSGGAYTPLSFTTVETP